MARLERKAKNGGKSDSLENISLARCLRGEECFLVGMLKIASLKLKSLHKQARTR